MSVYSVQNKGWRYDFTHNGTRHTGAWFKTRKAAQRAEGRRKEELRKGPVETEDRPTDMEFLELVNRKLDHVKAYNSPEHYRKFVLLAKRWVRRWNGMTCGEISRDSIQEYVLEKDGVSPYTANQELRHLRAVFNFGMARQWIKSNPTAGISFLPEERNIKYVPAPADIDRVIAVADPETQDYLWVIRETLARVGEINRLTWDDVDLDTRMLALYTRKKRGGHRTPRRVWMTDRLFEILSRRSKNRIPDVPWVFDHAYRMRKAGKTKSGPFADRREIIKALCKRAGVRPFGFHALRHSGASVMDNNNVPIGTIQRILGHENRTTTEIYLHGVSESEREAMRVYERAREKKSHTKSHTAC